MVMTKGVKQGGCTVYSLEGFPYDHDDEYTKAQLEKLRESVGTGAYNDRRVLMCSLNSSQKKAKKILEENGFKVLARTYTSHIDGYASSIRTWMKTKDNENTIYLMGRGFFKKTRAN